MIITYKETDRFKKDFKHLLKKYKTIESDFELMKRTTIELFHLNNINNNSIFLCEGQQSKILENKIKIYKIKKIACKSLKGSGCNSGLRIIYAYFEKENIVEFLQFYYKNESVNEDRELIKEYLRGKENEN